MVNIHPEEILAVVTILNQHSAGRYQLSEILQTTKARIRLILSYLVEINLVLPSRGRGGSSLTQKGKKFVNDLHQFFIVNYLEEYFSNPEIGINDTVISAILTMKSIAGNGLYERDIAVRQGASGSVMMVRNNDRWYIPPINDDSLAINLILSDKFHKFSSAFIVFGENKLQSLIKIVTYHLEDEILHLIDEYSN